MSVDWQAAWFAYAHLPSRAFRERFPTWNTDAEFIARRTEWANEARAELGLPPLPLRDKRGRFVGRVRVARDGVA